MKNTLEERNQSISNFLGEAIDKKLIHLDGEIKGRRESCRFVHINGEEKLFFACCSYLGLETDNRLREASKQATDKYGTQFASGRVFLGVDLNKQVEQLLAKLFNAHPLLMQSVTLGHLATFPAIIGTQDAIVLDKQAHNSMHMAANLCLAYGVKVEIINHNDMEQLETTILELRSKGLKNIWYMADGIYSMYGDAAPMNKIKELLNKYDFFYAYIDDAHGMSWTGKNGRGFVLGCEDMHPKMIVAVSLAKAFGVGGGVVLFPNKDWLDKVRTVGPTAIFSGPVQPPLLGAIIASLDLHLSGQIESLQRVLDKKISYIRKLLHEKNINIASSNHSPIIYIPLGSIEKTHQVVEELMEKGYFVNFTAYPLVSRKLSGIRISVNNHLEEEDIYNLCSTLSDMRI